MKPHADVETGEIHGCEEGSLSWWHEKGHIEFNSNSDTSWLLMIKSYVFEFWMIFTTAAIVYNPMVYISITLLGTFLYMGVYEEWWCNRYAKLNYKEDKK